MDHIYIKQLKESESLFGTEIEGIYFCKKTTYLLRNTKIPSYLVILSDKTGEIPAKVPAAKMKESLQGKPVCVNAIVSMFNGKRQLEIFSIHEFIDHQNGKQPSGSESLGQKSTVLIPKEMQSILVCKADDSYVHNQILKLRTYLDELPDAYRTLALSVVTREPVLAMGQLPASERGAFCYNGGLLDKTCYLIELAKSLAQTDLPQGAYEQITVNTAVVILSLIFSCMAEIGHYLALPDGSEQSMTGGVRYLPRILSSLDRSENIEQENVIHCLRVILFQMEPLTLEAEVAYYLWRLADCIAIRSYANFTGLTDLHGHYTKKGGD